ncbi:unnamed protein product [Larinioides sclopetarius]|uniref:Uncharacterized protein n=1 Tax=Larinioides sclopetarius TaxID=280406 RepID=A0AAV2A3F8_9ARAC
MIFVQSRSQDNGESDKRLFLRRKRQPYRRGSDDDSIGPPHLPPLSNIPIDIRTRRANSRFSNSSSNSSTSVTDRSQKKLKKVEEFEEPLRKRFGILPSLRLRRGRGTSSDSEVLIYNKLDGKEVGNQNSKKMYQQGRRQEIAEVRRNKNWSNSKAFGY